MAMLAGRLPAGRLAKPADGARKTDSVDLLEIWQAIQPSLLYAAPLAFTLATAVVVAVAAIIVGPMRLPPGVPQPTSLAIISPIAAWAMLTLSSVALGLTRADRANASSYRLLQSRLDELSARRDWLQRQANAPKGCRNGGWTRYQQLAFDELNKRVLTIEHQLGREGPQWVMGHAYISLWRQVHRAEEAWLRLAPREELIASIDLARQSLSGSDSKLNVADLKTTVEDVAKALGPSGSRRDGAFALNEARARLTGVWYTIHRFRDDRWQGLVNARNQVVIAMGLSGIVLYGLIWLAIFLLDPTERWRILGATVIFIVGATVGLFNRLYAQSQLEDLADDYGYSMVRLVLTPQLSGLAALLGLGLVAVVSKGTGTAVDWKLAFDVGQAPNLVLAAVFGLTPGLLVNQIKGGEQLLKEVKSTLPGENAS